MTVLTVHRLQCPGHPDHELKMMESLSGNAWRFIHDSKYDWDFYVTKVMWDSAYVKDLLLKDWLDALHARS